jgi:phosphoglycerate-specific signal transduction histidine kinase
VCKALDEITNEQWEEQVKKTDTLVAWKNWMTGAMAAIGLVLGLGIWVVKDSVNNANRANEKIVEAVYSLEREMAVFRQEVKPFVSAGPRFTQEDYDRNIRADLADFKETLPPAETKQQIANIEDRLNFKRELIAELKKRIEALEAK